MLEIHSPTLDDAEALLEFELENRNYFEGWINAREPDYYNLGSVQHAIEMAQSDASADKAYQFLRSESTRLNSRHLKLSRIPSSA